MNLKKTAPNYKLTDRLTLARLRMPETFEYKHKHRLYKEVSEAIIQSFHDLHLVFHRLPLSYQIKIMSDSSFQRFFTDQIFTAMANQAKKKKQVNKKKKDQPTEIELYTLYQTFFNIGIEGLINTMPDAFRQDLLSQTRTIVNFMRAISDFARQTNPKLKVPIPYIPASLAEVRGL